MPILCNSSIYANGSPYGKFAFIFFRGSFRPYPLSILSIYKQQIEGCGDNQFIVARLFY